MNLREAIDLTLRNESPRDHSKPKGTIKGVPFVDSPQPDVKPDGEKMVVLTASEYKRLLAGQNSDARFALVVAGAALALALFGVANIWH